MPTPVPRLFQRAADGAHQSVAGEEDPGAALDPAVRDAPGDEAPAGTPGTGESAKNCAHDVEWSAIRSTGSFDSPSSTIPGRAAAHARRPGPVNGPRSRPQCRISGSESGAQCRTTAVPPRRSRTNC